MRWLVNVLICCTQLLNAVLWGWPDESTSARAWRRREHKRSWAIARRVIDGIFFWMPNHCQRAFEAEAARRAVPPAERRRPDPYAAGDGRSSSVAPFG